jgi:transposase
MKGFLTKDQRKELLRELRQEDKARFSDRIKVILLLDEGRKYSDIAAFLFLNEGTIANYRKRYVEGGIEELLDDHYQGGTHKISNDELIELQLHLTTMTYQNTHEICEYVKKKYRVSYTLSGMIALLHRMGFSYKKTKGVPGKANKQDQEDFIKAYEKIKSSNGKIYFADSTHPQHNPVLSYGWIKTGEDVEIKTNSGRKHLNISGAIEINSQDVITRSSDRVDAKSICILLKAIRGKNPFEKNITLIMDNAAYNRSWKVKALAKELKIKLFYLPPYSPNLNPIERLWKFMKKKVIYNKYYEKFDEFEYACMTFFRGIRKFKTELETLITDNFRAVGA